jgi:hypothetical protein
MPCGDTALPAAGLRVDRPARPWDFAPAQKEKGAMQFNQRQWFMIALFAIFWTAFMLFWNGDYGTARVAIMLAIGVVIALIWGFWMKKYGAWKEGG